MQDKPSIIECSFEASDKSIHALAATILLNKYESEFHFIQDRYSYWVKGGDGGFLYYKKEPRTDWILIAIWCLYGLYIVIRYRKPIWLRPMYESLFAKMHFVSTTFDENNIELINSEGQTLRSRRFRLSPPSAVDQVLSEKLNLPQEKIDLFKKETDLG